MENITGYLLAAGAGCACDGLFCTDGGGGALSGTEAAGIAADGAGFG